jgi:hypothetical protein
MMKHIITEDEKWYSRRIRLCILAESKHTDRACMGNGPETVTDHTVSLHRPPPATGPKNPGRRTNCPTVSMF